MRARVFGDRAVLRSSSATPDPPRPGGCEPHPTGSGRRDPLNHGIGRAVHTMDRVMKRGLHLLLGGSVLVGCAPTRSANDNKVGPASGDKSVANDRCSMGFAELFRLARGREWTEEEVREFQALDQPGRNRMVKQLAAEAGGVRTEDRIGTDGVVYTAFWRE